MIRPPLSLLLALLPLFACSESTGPSVDLSGSWNAGLVTTSNTPGYGCTSTVAMALNQNGSAISGTYSFSGTCTTPHDRRDDNASGAIAAGRMTGDRVTFEAGACKFEGSVASSGNRLTGTVQCTSQAGLAVAFVGNWEANRMTPLVTTLVGQAAESYSSSRPRPECLPCGQLPYS